MDSNVCIRYLQYSIFLKKYLLFNTIADIPNKQFEVQNIFSFNFRFEMFEPKLAG